MHELCEVMTGQNDQYSIFFSFFDIFWSLKQLKINLVTKSKNLHRQIKCWILIVILLTINSKFWAESLSKQFLIFVTLSEIKHPGWNLAKMCKHRHKLRMFTEAEFKIFSITSVFCLGKLTQNLTRNQAACWTFSGSAASESQLSSSS